MRVAQDDGIELLVTDDSPEVELMLTDEEELADEVTNETRRSVISDKFDGYADAMIAVRHGLEPSVVSRIIRAFKRSTVEARRLSDENPDVMRHGLRRKAIDAIEAGLDFNADPYRRAALGHKIAVGLGEFLPETGAQAAGPTNVQVNVLVTNVPEAFKGRYLMTKKEK